MCVCVCLYVCVCAYEIVHMFVCTCVLMLVCVLCVCNARASTQVLSRMDFKHIFRMRFKQILKFIVCSTVQSATHFNTLHHSATRFKALGGEGRETTFNLHSKERSVNFWKQKCFCAGVMPPLHLLLWQSEVVMALCIGILRVCVRACVYEWLDFSMLRFDGWLLFIVIL